jgi:uncharacterized protein
MVPAPKLSGGSTTIDLRGIQEGTHPVVLEGGGASLVLDPEEGGALRRFRFEGSLDWYDEDRRVRGFLSGALETRCDRCLEVFERDIRSEIDVPVRRATASEPDDDSAPEGADDTSLEGARVVPRDASVLDLADDFRQAALLEVPIKNVCRDDCRGICASCGANLNLESCPHAGDSPARTPPEGDPRWDALRRLSLPADPPEEADEPETEE